MSTPFPHRIRRLLWQARAPTPAAAFALRGVLRDAADPVLAALAERLSAHSPDDRVVRLERLELQLRLDPAFDPDALPAQVAAAADEALAGLAWPHTATPAAEDSPPVPTPESTPSSWEDTPTEVDESSPADTAPLLLAWLHNAPDELREAVRTALAHVDEEAGHGHSLHTAILDLGGEPLPLPVPTLRELARRLDTPTSDSLQASDAISHDDTLELPPTQVSAAAVHAQAGLASYLRRGSPDWSLAGLPEEQLRALLTEAALAWASLGCLPPDIQALPRAERLGGLSRWLALLPAARRRQVVDAHAATVPRHPLSRALQALLAATAQLDDGDSLHAQALWLAWTLEGEPATDDRHHPWRPVARAWLTALFATRSAEPHWQAVLDLLKDTPPHPAAPMQPAALADDRTADRASPAQSPSRNTQTRPQDAEPAAATPRFDQRPASSAPAGQLVPQAGLVLLHPYLPRLFEAVGLIPAGHRGPLPKAVLPRAAALLHGLASGTTALEFELPFVKLLLGLPPDTPFSHALPALTEAERAEAEALLAAVLAHWQALRGTTTDGLRTAFLRRRGHLRRQDETWQLRVEPESFDLLLGLLPWSIGLVRLPWMPWPLLTEWGAP
ncbi:contractile injection system tape measure protein [Zoogloea sp.]|uniref:contractile injection system tape measure protein n=1 Tax=Zoogloea sp. TaxID=49181 RepID=UPI0035B224B1